MAGLNLGLIKELQLRVPPMGQQEQFEREVASIRLLEAQMRLAADKAEDLFHSLIQRAFRGDL